MYRLLIVLACATGGATGCQEGVPPAQKEPVDQVPLTFNVEQNPTIEFMIPAFRGEACCQGANEVLAQVPGVVDVYASDKNQWVIMAVDQATFDKAAAKAALETRFGPVTEVIDPRWTIHQRRSGATLIEKGAFLLHSSLARRRC